MINETFNSVKDVFSRARTNAMFRNICECCCDIEGATIQYCFYALTFCTFYEEELKAISGDKEKIRRLSEFIFRNKQQYIELVVFEKMIIACIEKEVTNV